jgi:hypothetical protein
VGLDSAEIKDGRRSNFLTDLIINGGAREGAQANGLVRADGLWAFASTTASKYRCWTGEVKMITKLGLVYQN